MVRPKVLSPVGENYAGVGGVLRSVEPTGSKCLAQAKYRIGLVLIESFRSGQDARKSLCPALAGQHLKPHPAIDTTCLLVVAVTAPDLDTVDPARVFLAHELQKLALCEAVEVDGAD